jgi:glycosyltransferase involved in cell wall biosynthesis
MRVAVSVHGRFHAFDLARGLHGRGYLTQLMTTYPRFAVRRFIPADAPVRCFPWLEAWRRADARSAIVPRSETGLARAYGRLAARHLDPSADLLVGWSSATLEAIAAARSAGARVIIERGSTHILHQTEVLRREYAEMGLSTPPTPPDIIERELAEYALADAIAVPSRFSARTFVDRGVARERLIVNPLGAAVGDAQPAPSDARRPVVLFVGQVGARKGVVWLLRAFAGLSGVADLRLVGPVERGFEGILRRHLPESTTLVGPLPRRRLAAEYARAHVFCLPSVEEGFGMVLLEAMAAGLPVVATDVTGAADVIRQGEEGLLVGPRDPAMLREALAEMVGDPARRRRMGEAARSRVCEAFRWEHYWQRSIAAYESLIAAAVPSPLPNEPNHGR